MELDKRNFTHFDEFPGSIDNTDGSYKFPPLYHKDHNGNMRVWSITVRLIKGAEEKYDIDWDLMKDNTVDIKKEYLTGGCIDEDASAQIYVETGVLSGKITRHAPTYSSVTNRGKSNERNKLEQALVIARTLYLKKMDCGFQKNKKFDFDAKKMAGVKYFPMLVRKYEDEKKHLKFPIYVQPKLDGARCVAFLNKNPDDNPTEKNVIMYTRQKKEYNGFENIKNELLSALVEAWRYDGSAYIDGELYKHGLSLQDISGAVRNPDRNDIGKYKGIKFHVFDIFYPHKPLLQFKDRVGILNTLFEKTHNVVKVPTVVAKTDSEQESMYKKFIQKKYEGVILRNMDSEYLTHPTKNSRSIRSKFVLKRKMTYDDEFEVVGFKEGSKGRDKGAIIWICKTKTTNKTFSATPKNTTYKERYRLYESANDKDGKGFDKLYKGRMMTVEYEDLSKDEVPLRAKAVGFRNHI